MEAEIRTRPCTQAHHHGANVNDLNDLNNLDDHQPGNTEPSPDPFEGLRKVLRSSTTCAALQRQHLSPHKTAAVTGRALTNPEDPDARETSHDQK
jgi:hypothetical protein